MKNDLVKCPYNSLLCPYPYITKNKPAHALNPIDLNPRKQYFTNTFFPRTVRDWNSLPPSTALAPSLEAFKASLVAG